MIVLVGESRDSPVFDCKICRSYNHYAFSGRRHKGWVTRELLSARVGPRICSRSKSGFGAPKIHRQDAKAQINKAWRQRSALAIAGQNEGWRRRTESSKTPSLLFSPRSPSPTQPTGVQRVFVHEDNHQSPTHRQRSPAQRLSTQSLRRPKLDLISPADRQDESTV